MAINLVGAENLSYNLEASFCFLDTFVAYILFLLFLGGGAFLAVFGAFFISLRLVSAVIALFIFLTFGTNNLVVLFLKG